MRVLYIILIFAITYTIGAQQTTNTATADNPTIKTEKPAQNVIDFKDPAKKIKPVKVINRERVEGEQIRKMGLSSTSGPVESLEKKQNVDSQLTNEDLKNHLRAKKIMHPMSK
jgi:hypothetical protein